MEKYLENYHTWLENPVIDEKDKEELRKIEGNTKEIEDRFYKDLEFGTAGLRGIIGIGTNRMNRYTVTKATQGLANYIIEKGGQERGVAIAYDSRRMSEEFSEQTALCFNANGIKTYRFDTLRPTPELSFAVRELGAIAGIVVTASHNPPEYNGYKVYWEDGAQIVEPTDKEIIAKVNEVTNLADIKTMSKQEALQKGLYHVIGEEIDKRYIEELKKLVVNQKAIEETQKDIKIVYTPLHGTGGIPVQTILKELGFENVYVVKEQEKPDGNFPTVDYPNPEDPKAFTLALELAKQKDADLVLANDPDADRLGIYVKNTKTGEYIQFNGNMTGNLIAEYILSQKQEHKALPENGAIIKTIVSSNLTDAIAKAYQVKLFSTLTGFKNVAKIIRSFEENHNQYTCLYSYEESYGCIIGTHARDKDGIVAVMTLCEAACYYKQKNMTLWDSMLAMYEKYGYYKERQFSITLKGIEGAEKIRKMMQTMRQNPPKEIAGEKVLEIGDYEAQTICKVDTGEKQNTNLPKSNVLYYSLSNDNWCCMRPSGTEPKIKIYMGVKQQSLEKAEEKLNELEKAMKEYAK
ncbi:MAG: phospho-sugar mutase [Clostridia bacterium]|nr:phospho-sugar mutase [Clostridia bacterium]